MVCLKSLYTWGMFHTLPLTTRAFFITQLDLFGLIFSDYGKQKNSIKSAPPKKKMLNIYGALLATIERKKGPKTHPTDLWGKDSIDLLKYGAMLHMNFTANIYIYICKF